MKKGILTLALSFILIPNISHSASAPSKGKPDNKLTCAENSKTFELMCFKNNAVRANGEVRATRLYRGGPNEINETSFTLRVHCASRVLEMTDRKGVAFARNRPEAQIGRDLVRFLCEHPYVTQDSKLKTN